MNKCRGHFVVKRFITNPNAHPVSVLLCRVATCASAGGPSLARRAPCAPSCVQSPAGAPVPASFLSSSCGGCGDTSSAQSRPCVQLLQEIRDSCLQLARLESVSFFLIMGECFCQGKNTVTLPGFLSDRPVSGVSVPICWRVPCAVFALLRPQGRESQGAGDPGNVVGRGV